MDPKPIRFERVEGRKPIVDRRDEEALAEEASSIRQADEADGTNAFLEAAFADATSSEPDYKW